MEKLTRSLVFVYSCTNWDVHHSTVEISVVMEEKITEEGNGKLELVKQHLLYYS